MNLTLFIFGAYVHTFFNDSGIELTYGPYIDKVLTPNYFAILRGHLETLRANFRNIL